MYRYTNMPATRTGQGQWSWGTTGTVGGSRALKGLTLCRRFQRHSQTTSCVNFCILFPFY